MLTGFYRTGNLFASDKVNTKPDIICLSKALTGGTMALGVTACSKKIYNAFVHDDKTKTFYHGHSFTANPLACSAAIASITLLEKKKCISNLNYLVNATNDFYIWLLKHQETFNKKIRNVRTCGTILAFEVISEQPDGYNNIVNKDLTEYSMSKGVFLRPLGNTIYTMPPYCIKKKELTKVFDVIVKYLNK